MTLRSLDELISGADDAWSAVLEAAERGGAHVLPAHPDDADRCLMALQVTTSSTLGAMAHHCAGVLIDHGWVRLLGAGNKILPGLDHINDLDTSASDHQTLPALVVGFDVLGGRFAIDGGGLGVAPGEVCYWAPDTLTWEGLGGDYTNIVMSFLGGAAARFYANSRWDGWEPEVEALHLDQALATWPPPFSVEGRDMSTVSRRAVPWTELAAFLDDAANQLEG